MPSFNSLIESSEWKHYIQHDFVQQLGKGTLDLTCFQYYLKQDYLFLINFSRAWGLAVYKSHDIAQIRQSLESLKIIVEVELDLHIEYCKKWHISEYELSTLKEAKANSDYTRYVLDIGLHGDILDIHIAMAPCLIGYGMIANWIQGWDENNPYCSWIEMYASKEFQQAVQKEIAWIEGQLLNISENRFKQLSQIFKQATQLEINFWQMALDKSD